MDRNTTGSAEERSGPVENLCRKKANTASALVLLTAAAPLVAAMLGATVDKQQKVRDSEGHLVWIASGHISDMLLRLVGLLVLAIALRGLLYWRKRDIVPGALGWSTALAWTALVAELFRGDIGGASAILPVCVATMVLVCAKADRVLWRALDGLCWATVVALVAFIVLQPSRAWVACRSDKCTVFGSLLQGPFAQENVAALYLLPLAMFALWRSSRKTRTWLLPLLLMTALYATGSRNLLLAAILGAIVLVVNRRGAATPTAVRVMWAMPTLLALISLVLFFLAPPDSLTGRGFIWAILRQGFADHPVLGSGRRVLQEAFATGRSANYLISHEHGQVPYILTTGGVVLGVIFFALLLSMTNACRRLAAPEQSLALSLLCVLALAGTTEPVWQLSYRTPLLWTFLLLVLMASTADTEIRHSLKHPCVHDRKG